MSTYAHPIDEPCPTGCPTRLTEIADYVNGWLAAYTSEVTLDADAVREALCTPPYSRDDVQTVIAQVEETYV